MQNDFASVPHTGLRPLGVGERIDATFKAYFKNFKSMAIAISMIAIPLGIIDGLISLSTTGTQQVVVTSADGFGQTVNWSALWTEIAGILSIALVAQLASWITSAVAVQIVGGTFVGTPVKWSKALANAFRRFPTLLGIFFLVMILYLVPAMPFVGLAALLIAANQHTASLLLLELFFVAYVVYCIFIYVNVSLGVPTAMLEGFGAFRSVKRSFALIKGSWWSVFGTLILGTLILIVPTGFVTIIFRAFGAGSQHHTVTTFLVYSVQQMLTLIVLTPFTATLLVVLAIDMRVRKEGLDLELLSTKIASASSDSSAVTAPLSGGSGFPTIGAGETNESWRMGGEPPGTTGELK
jgi:hypothetical protein